MPAVAALVQRRIRDIVRDHLADELLIGRATGERLYVLEFAGPAPRVKIGRAQSLARVKARIDEHLREKAKHGYGLVNACVTKPIPHAAAAEAAALVWMGYAFARIPYSREEFAVADFHIAAACAEMNVWKHDPNRDDDL